MFCRISADGSSSGDMRYYPFRLTPYLLTLRDSDTADPQPCCLLIAERVHSGYEGRTHTPTLTITQLHKLQLYLYFKHQRTGIIVRFSKRSAYYGDPF